MKSVFLGTAGAIAAATLYTAPAVAMDGGFGRNHPRSATAVSGAPFNCGLGSDSFGGDRRGRRGGRGGCSSNVIMDWYGGEWALYNNRSWNSDSYNDWWHDNPSRAYPAWMQRNQDCARKWYAGDTLSC